jgi:hypothetical protein
MALQRVVYKRMSPGGDLVESYHSITALIRAEPIIPVGVGRGGQISPRRARWHIKANELGFVPRHGDQIVSDEEGTWEVMDCSIETMRTRYSCNCVQVST